MHWICLDMRAGTAFDDFQRSNVERAKNTRVMLLCIHSPSAAQLMSKKLDWKMQSTARFLRQRLKTWDWDMRHDPQTRNLISKEILLMSLRSGTRRSMTKSEVLLVSLLLCPSFSVQEFCWVWNLIWVFGHSCLHELEAWHFLYNTAFSAQI